MATKIRKQNLSLTMHGDVAGYIEYTDSQKSPKVSFEVVLKGYPIAKKAIIAYLQKQRVFLIPISHEVTDQYREDIRKPIANIDYFEQSLNELGSVVGIFIHF